jgi:hypothetical protein
MVESMAINVSVNGIFQHLWTKHTKNDYEVYPALNNNKFTVTPTTDKKDEKPIEIQDFIEKLANGDYDKIGSIRMNKDGVGFFGNLRTIKKLNRSDELKAELEKIRIGKISTIHSTDEIDDIEAAKESLKTLANDTERKAVIKSRLGQGVFRELLIQKWGACSVTGMNFIPMLRASHIKPWCVSSNEERLDPENGLLLIPNLDVAFDRGFISFNDCGEILISTELSLEIQIILGIDFTMKLTKIFDGNKKYLDYHRNAAFRK